MPVPEELLEILRCPVCLSELEEKGSMLGCTGCWRHYPVDGDVPVMLEEAAFRPDEG